MGRRRRARGRARTTPASGPTGELPRSFKPTPLRLWSKGGGEAPLPREPCCSAVWPSLLCIPWSHVVSSEMRTPKSQETPAEPDHFSTTLLASAARACSLATKVSSLTSPELLCHASQAPPPPASHGASAEPTLPTGSPGGLSTLLSRCPPPTSRGVLRSPSLCLSFFCQPTRGLLLVVVGCLRVPLPHFFSVQVPAHCSRS